MCYILYTEDSVYLPEEAHREEYIMNESGIIWAGAHSDMFTWPWNFAQVSSRLNRFCIYPGHVLL